MFALIVLLGSITGGLSSILCPTKVDPQITVHLSHPTSCSKFLTCVGSFPIEQDCPAGLHWNIEKSFCDYPQASGCSRGENSDQLEQMSFNRTAVANSICLPQSNRCPLNSNPSEDIIFLKHQDCRKFYACVSTQQVELSCPPGLYWNSRACVCDYEVEAECGGADEEIDDVPEDVDEEQSETKDAEEQEHVEKNQEPADEASDQSQDGVSEVRVRRAADGDGSSGSSGSSSGSGTSESGSSSSGSSGSGSSGSGSTSNGQGSSGNPVQSGANIRTFSSIAMIAFTAAMSVM